MKRIWIAVILCIAACSPSQAEETKEKVSPTFTEILTRVVGRDKDSGAITTVRMRADAPPFKQGELIFTMYEQSGTVVIKFYTEIRRLMVAARDDQNVYEMYRLAIDENIREELAKLKLMREQKLEKDAEEAVKLQKEQSERIESLTNSKLKYGMTQAEVIAILGKPKKQPAGSDFQQNGRFIMQYDDYYLDFLGTLQDVLKYQKND